MSARPVRFPVSLLFDLGRRPGVDGSGRSSFRRFLAVAARSEGQGRRHLAPGLEPHPATGFRREHGEDLSLACSEHRGTQPDVGSTSYPQVIACVRTKGSRILWVQGFRLFRPLICLNKQPRPLTNGGPVLTNGGPTPD